MTKKNFTLLVLVLVFLFGVTACANQTVETVQLPEEEPHVYPEPFYDPDIIAAEVEALRSGEPLPVQQEDEQVAEPTEVSEVVEPEPVEEPEPETESCVECHTDKDALIATAKPEVEVAAENEGEG